MSYELDPEGRETAALRADGDWATGRTLEIGCGDGRLSVRLRHLGAAVSGVDPALASIADACRWQRASLLAADARHLPFADGQFTRALFGWSL